MKLLVILWIVSLTSMSGQGRVFQGTIDQCLFKAQEFNQGQKDAIAGCYMDVEKENISPPPAPRPMRPPPPHVGAPRQQEGSHHDHEGYSY